MSTLPGSILWGFFLWYFIYLPRHHKMPWVKKKKGIVIKRKKNDWEK